MKLLRNLLLLIVSLLPFVSLSLETTTLLFWHSLQGPLETALQDHIKAFEALNPDIHVDLHYQGNYTDTFQTFLNATDNRPHIIQVAEYQTHTLAQHPDRFRPVDTLVSISPHDLPLYISDFYVSEKGEMRGLPFNVSLGVMYINQTAWEAAGLNSQNLPRTWQDLEKALEILKKHGFGGLSTAWPAAYLVEHMAAIHGIPIQSGNSLDLSHPWLSKHLQRMVKLAKSGLYVYGGRYSDAEQLFTSGQVSVFFQGANRMSTLGQNASFPLLIAGLPFDKNQVAQPYAMNTGGASLWVSAGHSDVIYEKVRRFLTYMWSDDAQVAWSLKTNYLPLSLTALEKIPHLPLTEVMQQTLLVPRTPASRGILVEDYARKRALLIDALENALTGTLSPAAALQKAQATMNQP